MIHHNIQFDQDVAVTPVKSSQFKWNSLLRFVKIQMYYFTIIT